LDNGIIDNIIDYTTAHLILGMIALQEEDYVSATEQYTAAFLITQEWTRNWTESRGLRVIDSRAALVQVYYEGIITNPEEPENYLQLANILMEFGVWDEALGYYRQYLTMVDNPDLQALVDTIQFYLELRDVRRILRIQRGIDAININPLIRRRTFNQSDTHRVQRRLCATGDVQFRQNIADMRLDRFLADG
jgi:tetratricopeptide (TPR) repeat protein